MTVFGSTFMGINIRTATPFDAEAACLLLRRSIRESCQEDHRRQPALLDAWLANKTPQTVAAWFATPSNYAPVAERNGELVGLALLNQAGKLALCYVLPEAQGTGVGRTLLEAIELQARAWNISKIFLHSTVTASGFFARQGFINAGKENSCFGLESDFFWKAMNATACTDQAGRKRFCNCNPE
jgi:N-acetylglutamate synthase-like GNAT family acetyltransferase